MNFYIWEHCACSSTLWTWAGVVDKEPLHESMESKLALFSIKAFKLSVCEKHQNEKSSLGRQAFFSLVDSKVLPLSLSSNSAFQLIGIKLTPKLRSFLVPNSISRPNSYLFAPDIYIIFLSFSNSDDASRVRIICNV